MKITEILKRIGCTCILLCLLDCTLHCCAVTLGHSLSSSTSKNQTCYLCHTLAHGPICQHASHNSQLIAELPTRQCASGEKHCIVRRYAYAPNGTDTIIWMMERNCSQSCTNECVITGDRVKLHLCTSCCPDNLCNTDSGASTFTLGVSSFVAALVTVFLLNNSDLM